MTNKQSIKKELNQKFEMVYDKNDVILFSSRLLYKKVKDPNEREKGILSNLYTSDFRIPYDDKLFHSSEQLLFYLQIKRWAKRVGYEDKEIQDRIEYLMNCKTGFEVKNTPRSMYFYESIASRKKKLIGHDNAAIDAWKNQYFILRLKYKYCKEFRDVLEKYKDKVWCEYSCKPTDTKSFAGVVWDEELQKYRGCNVVGRTMRRVYNERINIMGEN